MVRLSFNSA